MARASGSYPAGRWFKSDIRYHIRLVGQAVKTRPFHGCNSGSIPLRVTNEKNSHPIGWLFFSLVPRAKNRLQSAPALCGAVRNIALPLPCRKPCRAEQIPLLCRRHSLVISPTMLGVCFFVGSSRGRPPPSLCDGMRFASAPQSASSSLVSGKAQRYSLLAKFRFFLPPDWVAVTPSQLFYTLFLSTKYFS